MKIVKVSPSQFEKTWNQLIPSQRISVDMGCPNIRMQHCDAILVLDRSVDFDSIEDTGELLSLHELFKTLLS